MTGRERLGPRGGENGPRAARHYGGKWADGTNVGRARTEDGQRAGRAQAEHRDRRAKWRRKSQTDRA